MKLKIKNNLELPFKLDWRIWGIIFLVCLSFSVVELRHNNLEMASLRNNVYAADKNNKGIEPALDKLQAYVTSHMNTSLSSPNGIYPPLQLPYTYQRLTTKTTDSIYHDAQVYCEKHQPVGYYGAYRLDCVESYIESHPAASGQKTNVPAALYQFDFISPSWSPDAAGWSMVALALSFIGLLGSFLRSRLHD